jgi:DNA-binding GntR family transcriptional regulator
VRELTQHASLREQAADAIRADIVAGVLPAGEILSATTLAQRLGVSQTPVREAMLDLASARLIEPVRNRGYRVVEMHDRDLDEIIALRMMLEVPAMSLVARHAARRDLEALAPAVEAIEQAADAGDVSAFLLADRQFHLGLMDLTGNRRLSQIVGQLRDQTRLVGLRDLAAGGGLIASATEHRPLLQALLDGDGRLAERLMRDHLRHARGIWAGLREPPRDDPVVRDGSRRGPSPVTHRGTRRRRSASRRSVRYGVVTAVASHCRAR